MASAGRSAAVSVLRLCLFRHNSKAEICVQICFHRARWNTCFFWRPRALKHTSKTTLMTHCWIRRRTLWRIGRKAVSDKPSFQSVSCPPVPSFAAKQHELYRGSSGWMVPPRLGYPAVPPVLLAFPSKAPRFARPQPNKQCISSTQLNKVAFNSPKRPASLRVKLSFRRFDPPARTETYQDSLAKARKTWISWHWSPHQTTTRNWEV